MLCGKDSPISDLRGYIFLHELVTALIQNHADDQNKPIERICLFQSLTNVQPKTRS